MRRVGLDSHYFQISDMTRWSFNKFVFLFKNCLFIYVWCIGSSLLSMNFLSCGKQKLLFLVVFRLLVAVASIVMEHRCTGSSSCGVVSTDTWAQQLWHTAWLLCSLWNLCEWGIKPVSSALESPNLLSSDIKVVWKLLLSYLEYCYYI